MQRIETDILILGAGSAGLSVAAGAVQMGARVVLLEPGEMGGDCLNYGCVPSKALLAAAKAAHGQKATEVFGITPVEPQVDYAAVMAHVKDVIAGIAPIDSQERFEGLGVTVIREAGRFTGPTEVTAGEHVITARRIVIATGSSPLVPPIPGLSEVDYLTNETLWGLTERPRHLVIVGGGPIGIEMAQAHVRLGSEVTVIEGSSALGKDDPEHAKLVLDHLRDEGVRIIEEAEVTRVSKTAEGISVETGDGQRVEGSHLLVAVGRKVETEALGLDAAGIETTKTGIKVNAGLKTTNRKVHAIGDAAGGMMFTHVAGYHASTIIRPMLFGLPAKAKTAHLPWVTYTDPELAQVGLTEAQARKEHGDALTVVTSAYDENDRARAERRTAGRIKVMVVKGRPVGASIVGDRAGDLIALWSLAIANGMKMSAIASMVAPYPTVAETSKRAAGAYFSPKLFDNPWVKRVVGVVQRWLP